MTIMKHLGNNFLVRMDTPYDIPRIPKVSYWYTICTSVHT